jgi:hypothetical protein
VSAGTPGAGYGYSYETGRTARRFTDRKRTVKGITIHHWGSRGQRFNNVVAWFTDPDTTAMTTAHYEAQGTDADAAPNPRVACIVDPDLIAWHAGDWQANVDTVGIECRPEAGPHDYAVVAELVARLWRTYGVVPLYPHKHWTSTACPGVWDLDKLRRLATAKLEQLRAGGSTPTPTPAPNTGDNLMAIATDKQLERLLDAADRTLGFLRQRYYVTKDGRAVPVDKGTEGARPATALDNIDGDVLRRQGVANTDAINELATRVAALEQAAQPDTPAGGDA